MLILNNNNKKRKWKMWKEVMKHCSPFPDPKRKENQAWYHCLNAEELSLKYVFQPPQSNWYKCFGKVGCIPSHLQRPAFLCWWFSLWRTCMQNNSSHIASNSSIRCFVLPCRICRRVLYLSRPALTFSACRTSFCVFLVSSLAWANSELNAYGLKKRICIYLI